MTDSTRSLRSKQWCCTVVLMVMVTSLAGHAFGQEPPAQAVARALAAHGNQWVSGNVQDWVAEGKLTFFTIVGPQATFDVTVIRKGKAQIQRIVKERHGELRHGSDGVRSWQSFGGFTAVAQGRPLQFIESQTARSVQTLFNHQVEGLTLRDQGSKRNARVIEAEDKQGRKTTYFIDDATSRITRLEFLIGQARDMVSKKSIDRIDAYLFSDFRLMQGLLTPFKIERYTDGFKTEEMQFSAVRYNASVKDDAFRPSEWSRP